MNENLKPIIKLRGELESRLRELLEEFQRRVECRGIQVQHIVINQVNWHSGFDVRTNQENETLKSGPRVGYRISEVKVVLVLGDQG